MTNHTSNKIKRLELENFTCFSKAAFDFSPGINMFIGENGTGKTHVLKVMYFMSGFTEDERNDLSEVFNVMKEPELIRERRKTGRIEIQLTEHGKCLWYLLGEIPENNIQSEGTFANRNIKRLFIPTQEMLSWYRGFSSLYNRREVDFDKTYFDLSEALGLPLLKNSALSEVKEMLKEIEEELEIGVSKKDDKFYIYFQKNEAQASVSATGINKIAQLIYLIMNGSLTKDTILFWDEPEANLNPKYITLVAKFLQTLANAGCQIFVASHDYLLVHELSFLSEYRKEREMQGEKIPDVKFFALYKGEDGSSQVEEGGSMSQIQNDAILDEYSAHDDREKAFWKTPYEKTSL